MMGRQFGEAPAKSVQETQKPKEKTLDKIKGFMSKVGEFFKKFENVDANNPEKMDELADEMIKKGQELKELAKSRKAEKYGEDYDEASEMNAEIDHEEANIMNEKITADKEAKKAEEQKKLEENIAAIKARDEAKAAEILARLNGGKNPTGDVDSVNIENVPTAKAEKINNDPTYIQLRKAFDDHNAPGNFNPEADARWKMYSKETLAKLKADPDISNIKEVSFYLTSEDQFALEPLWDKLSGEEIKNATSEDEMKKALENMRSGRFPETIKLKDEAYKKFPQLRNSREY